MIFPAVLSKYKNIKIPKAKAFLAQASLLVIVSIALSCKKHAPTPGPGIEMRDPSMIYVSKTGKYYVFGTGAGINVWSSTDLKAWKQEPNVFKVAPGWTYDMIPNFDNNIWAPDISYHDGKYYLFYAVSQFGTLNSAIGYATNVTLDAADSTYQWVDHGRKVSSIYNYNAIDPNYVTDYSGNPYLVYGSFYDGITVEKLQDDTLQQLNAMAAVAKPPVLASRSKVVITSTANSIEAPFIFKYNNYYYLFASINSCCAGINSNYQTIVGRSTTIDGEYYDKNNVAMSAGGGTVVLQGSQSWHAAGGESVYQFGGAYYIVYFSYDNTGTPRLRVSPFTWDAGGWPVVQASLQ